MGYGNLNNTPATLATLLAHAGHGATDPASVGHYALEPVHSLPVLALAAALVALLAYTRWRRSR
jgi:hypothetical protein